MNNVTLQKNITMRPHIPLKRFSLFSLIVLFASQIAHSQITVTLQPNAAAGQDARIWSLEPSTPAGTVEDFIGAYWTWGGTPGILRSLIKFDLSSIPTNANITSAKLSLYYNPTSTTAGQAGTNASWLQRITSDWQENTVTWNTQPTVTTSGEASLAQSTTSNQDYLDINVKNMVNHMVSNPATNYGFLLRLQNETSLYSSMKFASSDYSNASLHPKLVIIYDTVAPPPPDSTTCVAWQPDAAAGNDSRIWSLEPSTPTPTVEDFIAAYWTWGGTPGILRSLIKFDLSSIPADATISSAKLSLHHNPTSTAAGQAGANASWLQRVTSAWEENTVTWNTQPTTTTQNQAALATSASSSQDYLNINVKKMVKYQFLHPSANYGFMLRLQDETVIYSSMKFASSDYSNPSLRPKLKVCYTTPNGEKQISHEVELEPLSLRAYPNPFSDQLTLDIDALSTTGATISITNEVGYQMTSAVTLSNINGNTEVDLNEMIKGLPSGMYFVKVVTPDRIFSTKILKQD